MSEQFPPGANRGRPAMLLAATWVTLGIFFLLPLAITFAMSFARRDVHGGVEPVENWYRHVASGAFIENYVRSMDRLYLRIFWRSIWMAILTTALCLMIAYPTAYYIALAAPWRWKNVLLALAVIPFWTSFLIRTYAWMLILRTEGLVNTVLMRTSMIQQPLDLLYCDLAVMIGLVYGELPFMILPVYASLEKLDRSLLEASADLGANRLRTFWRVTLPLTAPGIAAGVVLVFVPSLGQYVVSDLLGGAKSILVGNLIQNQFSAARNQPFGSAVAFELTAIVLLLLLAYTLYSRRSGEELI